MTAVLIGVGVLGGLGLILGLLLSVANKVFEIPSDPKRDAVRNALPGANCGGCGYAGCDALADAIAAGKAPVNACPVGGAAAAAEIAKIMGVEETPQEVRKVATVVCQGTLDRCKTNMPAWVWAPACGPANLTPFILTSIPESPRLILRSVRAAARA